MFYDKEVCYLLNYHFFLKLYVIHEQSARYFFLNYFNKFHETLFSGTVWKHGTQSVTVISEYFNFVCRYTGLLYKDGKSAVHLSGMCTV